MGNEQNVRISSNMNYYLSKYVPEEGSLSYKVHLLMKENLRRRMEVAGDPIPQYLMTEEQSEEYLEELRKLKILKLQREQAEVDAARLRTEEEARSFKEKQEADLKAGEERKQKQIIEVQIREELIKEQEKQYKADREYNRQRKVLEDLVSAIEGHVDKLDELMPLIDALPESFNSDGAIAKIEKAEKREEERKAEEERQRLYWEEYRRKQDEYFKEHPTDPDWAKKAPPPPKRGWRPW